VLRRVAGLVLALAGCLFTAGCTPAPLGLAGVILDDGHPSVLIRPCPGIAVTGVWVYQRAADLRWGTVDNGEHALTDMRLLRAPAGWTEPTIPPGHQLSELSPGVTYQVQLSTDHPERGGIDLVEFTVNDLSDTTVWATRPHGTRQVLSRAEFDRQAAQGCR
jgi:hypothetical protein